MFESCCCQTATCLVLRSTQVQTWCSGNWETTGSTPIQWRDQFFWVCWDHWLEIDHRINWFFVSMRTRTGTTCWTGVRVVVNIRRTAGLLTGQLWWSNLVNGTIYKTKEKSWFQKLRFIRFCFFHLNLFCVVFMQLIYRFIIPEVTGTWIFFLKIWILLKNRLITAQEHIKNTNSSKIPVKWRPVKWEHEE